MGTAKVSDVMSLFPGASPINDLKGAAAGSADEFAKAINDAASKTAPVAGGNATEAVKQAPKSTRPVQKTDNADAERVLRDNVSDGKGESTVKTDKPTGEEIDSKVNEKIDTVRDAIKEKLGVTDEELEDAMTKMGLVPMDLLNADNLKGLMLELSGEQDPLALITNETLLTNITEVTELVTEVSTELFEELGITVEDIKDMLDTAKDTAGVPVEMAEVSGEISEDTEDPDDNGGVRIEVTRRDDTDEAHITKGSTAESASLDRKAAQIMNDRKQEDGMQNAMTGQNFTAQSVDAEPVVQAAPEFTPSYVDAEDVLSQVTDRIKVEIGEDQTSMELQLHPASLGTVNLQINSNGGVVTAHLLVQNEAVKSALESQLVQLLQTFEEQGQKVEAIEVSVAGYDLDRSLNQGGDTGNGERNERRAEGVARTSRRRLNLNELNEEDFEELTEEEQLAAELMTANGTSVDFKA